MAKKTAEKGVTTGRRAHLEEKKAIYQARLEAINAELKALNK